MLGAASLAGRGWTIASEVLFLTAKEFMCGPVVTPASTFPLCTKPAQTSQPWLSCYAKNRARMDSLRCSNNAQKLQRDRPG
jgi:hypothetical protein